MLSWWSRRLAANRLRPAIAVAIVANDATRGSSRQRITRETMHVDGGFSVAAVVLDVIA
jgi:hypothetical protein